MKKPQYSNRLLIRLIRETQDRDDLIKLNTLYTELEEQGDIVITHRMVHEVKAQEVNFNLKDRSNRRKK